MISVYNIIIYILILYLYKNITERKYNESKNKKNNKNRR